MKWGVRAVVMTTVRVSRGAWGFFFNRSTECPFHENDFHESKNWGSKFFRTELHWTLTTEFHHNRNANSSQSRDPRVKPKMAKKYGGYGGGMSISVSYAVMFDVSPKLWYWIKKNTTKKRKTSKLKNFKCFQETLTKVFRRKLMLKLRKKYIKYLTWKSFEYHERLCKRNNPQLT